MMRAGILGAVVLGLVMWGCGLVTGGTDGYTQGPDGGGDGGPFSGDAGSACGAGSDCDGGVCCLSLAYALGTPRLVASCMTNCSNGVQLCTTNADCGDPGDGGAAGDAGDAGEEGGAADGGSAGRAGACMRQQCDLGGGLPVTFGICGQVFTPYCAAAP